MELTDAQLAALLRQADEAWVNMDAVLGATEGLVAEVWSLRARIADADQHHVETYTGDGDETVCPTCRFHRWPCPTHTALRTSEENA